MRKIYIDGSFGARGTNLGGWSFLEVHKEKIIFEKFQSIDLVINNNNKMELMAALEAVNYIKDGEEASIYSDSQYVVRGIDSWIEKWDRNNWKSSEGITIEDKDLWLSLKEKLKNKKIHWVWLRAHNHDPFNIRVDYLAKMSYLNPKEIKENTFQLERNNIKPSIGSVIYLQDKTKKFIVILTDVMVNSELGILVKLLANHLGEELVFLPYKDVMGNYGHEEKVSENKIASKTIKKFHESITKEISNLKNK